jgi:D-alanyl-D-alanine dipeptidase
MKTIQALSDLVDMSRLQEAIGFSIDLPYAQAKHPENIFKQAIYAPNCGFYLHKDLAAISLLAAERAREIGWHLVFRDALRPTDAQAAMAETAIVKANPHWLQEPRLLSPPGAGGHPRAMAVDITANDNDNNPVDFGTVFDHLTEDQCHNPAHRAYADLPRDVLANRKALEKLMVDAARDLELPLLPLPQEWWDFRMPPEVFNSYKPLAEKDLPSFMRMIKPEGKPDLEEEGIIFEACADALERINGI